MVQWLMQVRLSIDTPTSMAGKYSDRGVSCQAGSANIVTEIVVVCHRIDV